MLAGKYARWWLKVFGSEVSRVRIVYRPGRQYSKADALSRNLVADARNEELELGVQVA